MCFCFLKRPERSHLTQFMDTRLQCLYCMTTKDIHFSKYPFIRGQKRHKADGRSADSLLGVAIRAHAQIY